MPAKLKPCPFCGGKAAVLLNPQYYFSDAGQIQHRQKLFYRIACHACGALTQLMETKQEAIEAWNRRTKEC